MKCPRCDTAVTSAPDPQGVVTCPTCNTRLRPQASGPTATQVAQLENLVSEVRSVRRMQGEILQFQAQILALLKSQQPSASAAAPTSSQFTSTLGSAAESEPSDSDTDAAPVEPDTPLIPRVRQRRKTALIVDDNPEELKAAVAALEQAQIPLRAVTNGNAALEALAQDKPDVLILELGLGEPLQGKDFINHVKATMEWVDIPIVLYTRIFVQSQQEARLVHGADEVVLKAPGSPEALLNRVIYIFQRH
jgi:CheY-like chemotaxis protein